MGALPAYVSTRHIYVWCTQKPEESAGRWLWVVMWVLGIQPGFSGTVDSDLHHCSRPQYMNFDQITTDKSYVKAERGGTCVKSKRSGGRL